MELTLEYTLNVKLTDEEVQCKYQCIYQDSNGKESTTERIVELEKRGDSKYRFTEYVDRGKILIDHMKIWVATREQNANEYKQTKFETIPDQKSIREKSEIEADLKEIKSWIQRDEEEAQKLMNKD